jgi:4-hydroxybenzoyl-CoA thioesterase
MLSLRTPVGIEWGDCDPAGIIFYPRYLDMFDACSSALIERALGMKKYDAQRHYDFAGHPLVATRVRFLFPTRFGDDVMIETAIAAVRRSSFDIEHRLLKNGELAVNALETRVWVGPFTAEPGQFKALPIPPVVAERFRAPAGVPA